MPEYDRERGSWRVFSLIKVLRQAGWAVSFAAENPTGGERYGRILNQMGVPVYGGFGPRMDDLIALGQLDLVILAFWYLAEAQLAKVRFLSPTTRVVVDTIDLHFLRGARRALRPGTEGTKFNRLDSEYGSKLVRELNTYASADAVLTVSEKEAQLLTDLGGGGIVAHAVPDAEDLDRSAVPFDQRRGIVFVGNFRHSPNTDAVEYLCNEVLPLMPQALLAEHPVSIVGNGLDHSIRRLARGLSNVNMIGWVPSVVPYLERARLSVIPLRYGAGTKGKLVQALMLGTPTVSSSVGAEGLGLRHGEHVLIADDPASFAASMVELLENGQLWRSLTSNGAAAIVQSHGWDVARNRLLAVMKSVMEVPVSWSVGEGGGPSTSEPPREPYHELVERVRRCVRRTIPANGTVLVVSKGDDQLLALNGCSAWHFPQAEDGRYAGHHPAGSDEAICHLEALRRQGAEYLLLPKTGFWWLDHYERFRKHLEANYLAIPQEDDACLLFSLRDDPGASWVSQVKR